MTLTIDCGTCSRSGTATCQDCVVTFIIGREPDDAVIVDAAEFAAVRRLQRAGLVPDLLHDDGRRDDQAVARDVATGG
ncbi:MAG: hypothetical protein OEZ14_08455 [Acidimicrobiia bacterium]|nr:hypothetical protein [Acidimicrobiia bacterium]MDH5520550.1 hypothetical protein [Acidimicrobiia bacterium]